MSNQYNHINMQSDIERLISSLKEYEGDEFLVNDALLSFIQENYDEPRSVKDSRNLIIVETSKVRKDINEVVNILTKIQTETTDTTTALQLECVKEDLEHVSENIKH